MDVKLALAGDSMFGRGVAEKLATHPPRSLFSDDLVDVAHEADLFVLNLECCVSTRGQPWPDPRKPFFFRAPPSAVEALQLLGVDCVTLANNHALDFGYDALLDTFQHLEDAGIDFVGAGPTLERARATVVLEAKGVRISVVGITDHPNEFAALEDRPGVALADVRSGVPQWLKEAIASSETEQVLVTPHWGPNMTPRPTGYVRAAADELTRAGATLIAGHSAHVFHGVRLPVLYDLGDFIDDYATDPQLRNDLGLLFIVTLGDSGPRRLEAVPLELEYCHTRLARGDAKRWICDHFQSTCEEFGTEVREADDRLVIDA